MEALSKKDLAQMDRAYFESLEREALIDVGCRLRDTAVHLLEELEMDSSNSSKPPSSDNPYVRRNREIAPKDGDETKPSKENPEASDKPETDKSKRPPGRQVGSQGYGRTEAMVPEKTIPHYPERCERCEKPLAIPEMSKPHMGHYVLELEKTEAGIRIACSLHHYYALDCDCGHTTKAQPGEGYISFVDGRKKPLRLTEYTLVGPMLATFLAALSVRYRMSRSKIWEFLLCWLGTSLSVGTIDKCIREAGIACFPVVDQLIEELQKEDKVHMDETPWHEKGKLRWLWVAISMTVAVFHVGTRKKEELLKLITSAFIGWLIADGYGAYLSYERRQRCLAHLIRKAIALTGAVDEKAQKMGDWFLRELRGLIKAMAEEGENGKRTCSPILARLKKACNLGSLEDHPKLRALAREILRDWDAVVAFVKNPGLPATNNEGERALRHAVISRRISFGTRTPEGTQAYTALLSVIETCRLRGIDPWAYMAQAIALGRKGQLPAPIPMA